MALQAVGAPQEASFEEDSEGQVHHYMQSTS